MKIETPEAFARAHVDKSDCNCGGCIARAVAAIRADREQIRAVLLEEARKHGDEGDIAHEAALVAFAAKLGGAK